jgi:hypothetical protein
LVTFHCVVHDVSPDELVIARVGELTVHLNVRLRRVWPIFRDDPLVDLLVGALDRAGVHHFCAPELSFAVKRLVKVPRIATRVAKRQPEAIWRVFCEKTTRHRPN